MQVLVERGYSKGDCVDKIVKKHGINFTILREKTIPSRLLGIIPEKVEVEYYLSLYRGLGLTDGAPLPAPKLPGQAAPAQPKSGGDTTIDFNQEKRRLLAAAGKDPDKLIKEVQEQEHREAAGQQEILDKLKAIQEQIDAKNAPKKEHPSLVKIAQILRHNDFTERYIAGLLDRARKELPLDTLEDFSAVQDSFLGWIGESIRIYQAPQKSGRVMVLVGPTGVGKTTTVIKLAAMYGIVNQRPLSVRVYTIDMFKIGAKEQLEKYGEVMEIIPFACVDNRRELRKEIDLYREETDLILVDTIGRSPRDSVKLGEMKELLDACGSRAEVHLVLSASTKTSDIEHILQQFEPFNYQAVLLTKLDETRHVGNIISALAEKGKPVSFISDGQYVPKDIKKASVVRFLINLDEFRVDRDDIEMRFPATEADQFQWGS